MTKSKKQRRPSSARRAPKGRQTRKVQTAQPLNGLTGHTAPALPSNVTPLGCYPIASQNTSLANPPTTQAYCSAPSQGTCYGSTPWALLAAQEGCIAGAGRWACEYADPEANCGGDNDIFDPP